MWYRFASSKEQLINEERLISAVVILKKQDNDIFVLLNERFPNKWELPGGKVEKGESTKEAAIREIKEETNININPKKLITIDEMMPEYKTDKRCNYYGYFTTEKDKIKSGSDAKNLQWFSINNLPNILWQGEKFIKKTLTKTASKKNDIFIFVDIDGVLNKNNQEHKEKYQENIYNLKEIILKDKIELLNQLEDKYKPTFVLSSYWRKYGSLYAFNQLFKELGFDGEFKFMTPTKGIEHLDRWKQIKKVIKKYKPDNFIIFDDKSINKKGTFDNKNLIHTNENNGLTQEDINKAIEILEGE